LADRIHGDDTTMPVLQTVTGRLWTYVRDDRPFGGSDPPAAKMFSSRERGAASALGISRLGRHFASRCL
jgi:hypothetical protein